MDIYKIKNRKRIFDMYMCPLFLTRLPYAQIIFNHIKFFFFFLTSFICCIQYAYCANPLGFKIGQTNYDVIKSDLSAILILEDKGINKYSGGKMLIANNPMNLGYNGLKKITFIFDHKSILTAVIMKLKRDNNGQRNAGFMYVYKKLNDKYLSEFDNLQPKGSMIAGFTTPKRNVHIRMLSKQASEMFDLQYLSNNFLQRYKNTQKPKKTLHKTAQYSGVIQKNIF